MKKVLFILIASVALFAVACEKDNNIEISESNLVEMSFTANAQETKTSITYDSSTNKYPVVWSSNDKILVIAVDGENAKLSSTVFDIEASGVGSASATFKGEADPSAVAYYAVYPSTINPDNVTITGSGATAKVAFANFANHDVAAVDNDCDPTRMLMIAQADAGNFAFKHIMVYYKLTVGVDGVKSIKMTVGDNDRIYGNPTFDFSTGKTAISGGSAANNWMVLSPTSGYLTKGASYYFPAVTKRSKVPSIKFEYTFDGDIVIEKTTTKLANTAPVNGTVYDLGTPPITKEPVISAANVTLESDATSGSIVYTIANPVAGGVLTAALKEASDWLTVGAVSDDSVALTSTANTSDARSAVVVLTYTYDTSKTSVKEVTVSQKAGVGAAESHVRILYNGNTELYDGESSSTYFTHSTNYVSLSASANNGGGIDYYAIPGTSLSSSKAIKLDSSGFLKFTTSSSLKSEVTFYYVMRKSGSGKIQITPTGGTATVFDDVVYATVNSKTVSLEKSTEYTIARNSGELLLIAVIVNETE